MKVTVGATSMGPRRGALAMHGKLAAPAPFGRKKNDKMSGFSIITHTKGHRALHCLEIILGRKQIPWSDVNSPCAFPLPSPSLVCGSALTVGRASLLGVVQQNIMVFSRRHANGTSTRNLPFFVVSTLRTCPTDARPTY